MKKTIEENDAGYQLVIDQKGLTAYENHNEKFIGQINASDNLNDCAQLINEWFGFFRSGHIGLQIVRQPSGQSEDNQKIIEQFNTWEKLAINLDAFKSRLEAKPAIDLEGIWSAAYYKFGIKKVGKEYIGFIIQGDGAYWTKGQVKFKIKEDGSAVYYMRDHSARHFDQVDFLGKNYLQMGFVNLKRDFPIVESDPILKRHFKAITAQDPYFELIDQKTSLLRIPSFLGSEKSKIDNVLNANLEHIINTPNLIIDIRNNGGGSDSSFYELLPILYTNPISTVQMEYLSTPLNNQRMLDFINNKEYGFTDEQKKWAQNSYTKLSEHLGEFVLLDEHATTETTFDAIENYPKNIGILIHEYNGSTAEEFLLAAKQSTKVKLFGTNTAGVLDISNMYYVNSPCNEFQLGYSLTRSMRIPEMAIDGNGIQPDFYMDQRIPEHEWIKHVTEILNTKN
ncbi:S41 family peptidase [Muricauda sp. 2012CJ35-5]|uniref:S41 family peptidase n=1 Tax=Flagellimonas spongiicola TaxID=2942208 RepID=A0ABT0PS52_9FLAO|nr:S41 family peptidase [Allomuricauda spongiicola]MCL6273283.1 S41 family peptidase [Allomuricauda spongiicola]